MNKRNSRFTAIALYYYTVVMVTVLLPYVIVVVNAEKSLLVGLVEVVGYLSGISGLIKVVCVAIYYIHATKIMYHKRYIIKKTYQLLRKMFDD